MPSNPYAADQVFELVEAEAQNDFGLSQLSRGISRLRLLKESGREIDQNSRCCSKPLSPQSTVPGH